MTMKIDHRSKGNSHVNIDQMQALELALGVTLPEFPNEWPKGMVSSWNEAARSGVFDNARDKWELAEKYLLWRFEIVRFSI